MPAVDTNPAPHFFDLSLPPAAHDAAGLKRALNPSKGTPMVWISEKSKRGPGSHTPQKVSASLPIHSPQENKVQQLSTISYGFNKLNFMIVVSLGCHWLASPASIPNCSLYCDNFQNVVSDRPWWRNSMLLLTRFAGPCLSVDSVGPARTTMVWPLPECFPNGRASASKPERHHSWEAVDWEVEIDWEVTKVTTGKLKLQKSQLGSWPNTCINSCCKIDVSRWAKKSNVNRSNHINVILCVLSYFAICGLVSHGLNSTSIISIQFFKKTLSPSLHQRLLHHANREVGCSVGSTQMWKLHLIWTPYHLVVWLWGHFQP